MTNVDNPLDSILAPAELAKAEAKTKAVKPTPAVNPNVIRIDLQNSDERTTLLEMMSAGRILADVEGREFILSVNHNSPYNPGNPPVRRIWKDEIMSISRYAYHRDLTVSGETTVRYAYWVNHKGHTVTDLIDQKTFSQLKSEGVFVHNVTVDILRAQSYNHTGETLEPDEMLKQNAKADKYLESSNQGNPVKDIHDTLPVEKETTHELSNENLGEFLNLTAPVSTDDRMVGSVSPYQPEETQKPSCTGDSSSTTSPASTKAKSET